MWQKTTAKILSYILTAGFVTIFLAMAVSTVFIAFAILSEVAFAAPNLDESSQVCMNCHGSKDFATEVNGQKISLYVDEKEFTASVHGTFSCSSCHQGTDSIPHDNIAYGSELKNSIQQNCLTCHFDLNEQFNQSIHGKLSEVACSDCHGEIHQLQPVDNENSPVYKFNIAETCQNCHEGMVTESYQRSFHGIALKFGWEEAASCVDCHSSHDILPVSDPESQVSEKNLPDRCVSCHGGEPSENWGKGIEHTTVEDREKGFPLWIVWKIFILLILVDIVKDLPIIIFELIKQLRRVNHAKKSTVSEKDIGI